MCRGERLAAFHSPRLDEHRQPVLVVLVLEALRLGRDFLVDVLATALLRSPPLLDVVVVGALAGSARRLVDGDLEARMEHDLRLPAAFLGRDLRWDVAPPDDGHGRHAVMPSLAR